MTAFTPTWFNDYALFRYKAWGCDWMTGVDVAWHQSESKKKGNPDYSWNTRQNVGMKGFTVVCSNINERASHSLEKQKCLDVTPYKCGKEGRRHYASIYTAIALKTASLALSVFTAFFPPFWDGVLGALFNGFELGMEIAGIIIQTKKQKSDPFVYCGPPDNKTAKTSIVGAIFSAGKDAIVKGATSFVSEAATDFIGVLNEIPGFKQGLNLLKSKGLDFEKGLNSLKESEKEAENTSKMKFEKGKAMFQKGIEDLKKVTYIDKASDLYKQGKKIANDCRGLFDDGKKIFQDVKKVVEDVRKAFKDAQKTFKEVQRHFKSGDILKAINGIVTVGFGAYDALINIFGSVKGIIKSATSLVNKGKGVFNKGTSLFDSVSKRNNPFAPATNAAKKLHGKIMSFYEKGLGLFNDAKSVVSKALEWYNKGKEIFQKGMKLVKEISDSKDMVGKKAKQLNFKAVAVQLFDMFKNFLPKELAFFVDAIEFVKTYSNPSKWTGDAWSGKILEAAVKTTLNFIPGGSIVGKFIGGGPPKSNKTGIAGIFENQLGQIYSDAVTKGANKLGKKIAKDGVKGIKKFAKGAAKKAKAIYKKVKDKIKQVKDTVKKIGKKAKAAAKKAFKAVKDKAKKAAQKAGKKLAAKLKKASKVSPSALLQGIVMMLETIADIIEQVTTQFGTMEYPGNPTKNEIKETSCITTTQIKCKPGYAFCGVQSGEFLFFSLFCYS
jgi:methyl-accepting chemotaxis protein